MKQTRLFAAALAAAFLLTACSAPPSGSQSSPQDAAGEAAVEIALSDGEICINGTPASAEPFCGVSIAHDIVYYEAGHDFTYGEGTQADAHTPQQAAEHTVVHISQPGAYRVSGTLSKGQIAVDLGEGAEDDPDAVVTLILDGADITCQVAPAILFYRVYECGSADADTASKDVDTSGAGANLILADGSTNTVTGSYVARIYKPDSVVLSEDGTQVEDAKKLHKYDGALYSKMSMNVDGETQGTGTLTIHAENEGLDSELHLTINGGILHIDSGNDGINTNEDGVSVTTINGGQLHIRVNGSTGEGDGIDSNGWLVINGGAVTAQACSSSGDAGIDSDMGIHINGGQVIATGHMLDRIEPGGQSYAVFTFDAVQQGGTPVTVKDGSGNILLTTCPDNDYSILVCSTPDLAAEGCTLYRGDTQLTVRQGGTAGRPGIPGMVPGGGEGFRPTDGKVPPELPDGMTPGQGSHPFAGQTPPDGTQRPDRGEGQTRPDGGWGPGEREDGAMPEASAVFSIADGENHFQVVSPQVQ